MSYRDLRNFTEMMRVLGYPRLISYTNFHLPNFSLVAEILTWLVKRFDPDAYLPGEYNSEQERVNLIRSVAEFMALKVNIRLNTKKLYQADLNAMKELLKITSLLYEAQNKISNKDLLNDDYNENRIDLSRFDVSDSINELKMTRQLGSELTVIGATLFDDLGREVELRDIRNSKVSKQFDTAEVQLALGLIIESTKRESEDMRKQIENVKDTEQSLDAKIERRRSELERNQKRLQALRKVRPAFMEEYEKLEVELRALYNDYLQKFRFLAYLEHLFDDNAKTEQERFERRQAATKKQLEMLRTDDVSLESMLEGNDSIFANLQENLKIEDGKKKPTSGKVAPSARISKPDIEKSNRMHAQRRIYGSMSGRQRGVIQESNDSESFDTDSDDLLIDDGDLDDEDDDQSDVLNDLSPKTEKALYDIKSEPEKRAKSKIDNDDDF